MIRFLGWCTLLAAFVAVGWYGREELSRMPRLKVEYSAAPQAATVTVTRQPARPPQARAAPQAARERPEANDAQGPWTPKGIGYYDVRDTSRH